MQKMLLEMEAFAEELNIVFSTNPLPSKSKSKCIFVVGKKTNLVKPAPLILGVILGVSFLMLLKLTILVMF